MKRRWTAIAFTIVFFLIAVGLISSRPGASAQDAPPPSATPAFGPIQFGPMVVGVPYTETFSTNYGWTATGAWQYVTNGAYQDGGWMADAFQREFTSTLEYATPIDLSGRLGAQLLYQQRGSIAPSDLIAVEISLDGGLSWFMVDQQTGLYTDWQPHGVDLATYRAQIIRLRFRLTTGIYTEPRPTATAPPIDPNLSPPAPTPAPIPAGYWIDNLSIQYVQPPVVLRPSHATKLGLHLLIGADRGAVLGFIQRMRDAGYPIGTVKGTSGTEDLIAAIKDVSPETVVVYRSLYTPWGMRDCPDMKNEPVAEARHWMDGILPGLTGTRADYYEIMNECGPDPAWMVPFTIEAMRIATERGVCLLVFSFGTGMPEVSVWAQFAPVYQYALANPCQPGRYHGIAMHAYGFDKTTMLSQSGEFLGLRHRLYYQQLLPLVPDVATVPVYITEAGPGDGSTSYPCDVLAADMIEYTRQIEADPYVKGFHMWNVGRGGMWVDFTACLPTIGDALIRYYQGG